MLATLDGVARAGYVATVAAPPEGPLAETLAARGIEVVGLATRDPLGDHRPQAAVRQELAALLAKRRPSPRSRQQPGHGAAVRPGDAKPADSQPGAPARHPPPEPAGDRRSQLPHAAAGGLRGGAPVSTRPQGLAAEKTFVLHNGVDLERFRPGPPTGYLPRSWDSPPRFPWLPRSGKSASARDSTCCSARRSRCRQQRPRPLSAGRPAMVRQGRVAPLRGRPAPVDHGKTRRPGPFPRAPADVDPGCSAR